MGVCAVGPEETKFPTWHLACTSSFPALPEEMHLRRIPHLVETFDVVPGLSDHTLGSEAPMAGGGLVHVEAPQALA
ncbi:N-acetylneuraminate synthase family protein [Salinibacter ruber]|uniref:N-acetylneuraminate synthase family protein n=1 Tax=Salinibacter ruber TaxID=146919 RepID=UPI003C6E9248